MEIRSNQKVHTSSSVAKYDRCPRLWYYEYQVGLMPPLPLENVNNSLSFGSCAHLVFETILRNKIEVKKKDWKKMLSGFSEHTSEIITAVFEQVEEYHPFINELKPIEVEEEMFGLYGGIKIAGKIDAIVEYEGALWVLDHKTSTRTLNEKRYWIHNQFNIYSWLAKNNGYDVKGVLVNFLRIPSLRKKREEDAADFIERVKQDIKQSVENSKKTQYFNLFSITKDREQVIRGMEDVVDSVYHMENDKFFRKRSAACFEFNTACHFFDVCTGEINEKDLVEMEKIHPELLLI